MLFRDFLRARMRAHLCSVRAWILLSSLAPLLRHNSVVNKYRKGKMTQDLITICPCETAEKNEFGGNFTPLQLQDQLMGLICIQCGTCKAAAKSASKANFQSLQEFLHTEEKKSKDSNWSLALTEDDKLRQQILNFAIYRINEPPNKDEFESNYALPIEDVDQIYLLWKDRNACGFVTLRSDLEYFENMDVIDTVFIRKNARGFGHFSTFVVERLESSEKDLGFSEPISNKMLLRLTKLLKKNPGYRERIWLVNEGTEKKVNLWWSVKRIAKKQNVDLTQALKA